MSTYTFTNEDEFENDTSFVSHTIETDSLQDVTEKFFWFIRASGFTYVDHIKVGNCEFSA